MAYSTVRSLFEKHRARSVMGDIVLLNSLIRVQARNNDPTTPEDCEALLLDLCPGEYRELPQQEQQQILAHTARIGGTHQ